MQSMIRSKQLGLNCSIFEDFTTENRVYVDKTKYIYNLITARDKKHFYFVSRPRRFGKSLFISTLKALFLGKKELFKECWIGKQNNYDWPEHPVIHLDFGGISHGTTEDLKQSLYSNIAAIANEYDIVLNHSTIEDALRFLVKALSKKNKIVLLIDEYDKPLVDHIDDLPLAEANRKILSGFYAAVKSLEQHWRAIFVTGVSKFTKTSLFSGLNNLVELSFEPAVAELFTLDYPNREIRESFKNYLMQAFAYTTPEALEMALVRMRSALAVKNFEEFFKVVKSLFAGIPYNLYIAHESYYHSLFHLMCDMLGMRPQSEVSSSRGRADLVLETNDNVIVFELKHNDSTQVALNQIIEKKYYEKYLCENKKIILIGVNVVYKDKDLVFEWLSQDQKAI